MKNLKITFNLKDGAILNRFTTIDSILLVHHYALQRELGNIPKDRFIETKDDLGNLSKWLEVRNGVLSGSIWYVDEDSHVSLWNAPIRKKTDVNAIYKMTGRSVVSPSKPTPTGEFKPFDLSYEITKVDKIHFYIKGDVQYIEKLLKKVKYIGAKSACGNGWISGYSFEEVSYNKSFIIDEFTPSKPIPIKSFNVDTKKIAIYRVLPPYSDKKNKELCFMPTTALVERSDNSRNNSAFKVYTNNTIMNTEFLFNNLVKNTAFDFSSFEVPRGMTKLNNDRKSICACCGKEFTEGLSGDVKRIFPSSFMDFPNLGKEQGICKECLWSIKEESCKQIDFSFITNDKVEYLYGAKMSIEGAKSQSLFRKEFVSNLDLLTVPYSININTNKGKPNHIGFKGNVAVSSAYAVFNFGDKGSEFVDVELLKEALIDMVEIMEKTKTNKKADSGLKKTHLLNFEDYKGNFSIAKDLDTLENRKILSNFYKKYDSSIRRILHIVVF